MYKVVLVLVWLKEVKEMVVVTVETDCHLAPEIVVATTVVTDCRQCLERLVSKVVDLGWMDKHLKQVTCPAAAAATTSKCVTERTGFASTTNLMQVVKGIRCRDLNKEMSPECKDRDQHGLVRNGFPNYKRLCSRLRKRV